MLFMRNHVEIVGHVGGILERSQICQGFDGTFRLIDVNVDFYGVDLMDLYGFRGFLTGW